MNTAANYYTARGVRQRYRKRLKLKNIRGGFTIPWLDADGKELFRQTRHVPPFTNDQGEEVKATYPKDTELDFYHLPLTNDRQWRDVYADKNVKITITESPSKGAALAQQGYAVVTTGSVWNHRSRKRKNGLIRGFDTIPWMGRIVRIMFDNDIHTNHNVQDALFDLGKELTARGAIVEVWLLPYPEWDEEKREHIKLGIDDFVAQHGPDFADIKAALKTLRIYPLADPAFSDWGKNRSQPKPSVVSALDFSPRPRSVLTDTPLPRQYVVNTLIGVGHLAYFVAAGGTGKGFQSLDLALHIAIGEPWMGMEVTQGLVVLLCLEDSLEEVDRRMHDTAENYATAKKLKGRELETFRTEVLNNVRYTSLEGKQLHIVTEEHRVLTWTPALLEVTAKLKTLKPILVIADPLNQLHALPETNEVGGAVNSALGYIRTEAKTAVLIAAHVSKDADTKSKQRLNAGNEFTEESANILRGGISFATGARSVFALLVYEPLGAARSFQVEPADAWHRFGKLVHLKCNYGPKSASVYLERNMTTGVWNKLDEKKIPLKIKSSDDTARLSQLERWLKAEKRSWFSKTDITQTYVDEIFRGGRPGIEKFFEDCVGNGSFHELSQEELTQLPASARKGGGARYIIVKTLNQAGQHA